MREVKKSVYDRSRKYSSKEGSIRKKSSH